MAVDLGIAEDRGVDAHWRTGQGGEVERVTAGKRRTGERPISGLGLLRRAGLGVGILLRQRPGRHLPEPAASHVQRDPRVPGAELAGRAQASQTDQGRDGGLLDDVGDQVIGTEEPPGQRHDHSPMPVSQAGEGLLVPRVGGSDELRVTQRCQIGHAL